MVIYDTQSDSNCFVCNKKRLYDIYALWLIRINAQLIMYNSLKSLYINFYKYLNKQNKKY